MTAIVFRDTDLCTHEIAGTLSHHFHPGEAVECDAQALACAGGCVVCIGPLYVRFEQVTFDNCTIVALRGAQVDLDGCTSRWKGDNGAGISLFGSGHGTVIRVKGGSVTGGKQAAAIRDYVSIQASQWKVMKSTLRGVDVVGRGSSITMHECELVVGTRMRPSHAVLVKEEDRLDVTDSKIMGGKQGVTVCRSTAVMLNRCEVKGASKDGFLIRFAGSAYLNDCTVHSVVKGSGVKVRGTDSHPRSFAYDKRVKSLSFLKLTFLKLTEVKMKNCTVKDCNNGIIADNGAKLECRECLVKGNSFGVSTEYTGIRRGPYSKVLLQDCELENEANLLDL